MKALQLHTDPLLVDVSQEAAVLLVEVVIQGVVPVLCLHQAEKHKPHAVSAPEAAELHRVTVREAPKDQNSLFLNQLGVRATVQSFTNHVADLGALSWTPGQPVHT